jgi:hypothetical protein
MIKTYIHLTTICRGLIYLSSFYLLAMALLKLEIDIILLTILFIVITLILLEMILFYIDKIQTALLLILLFCFGFYLKLGLIIYDPDIFGYTWTTLGNFNFEFNQFFEVYLVTIVSTIGIVMGLYLSVKNNTIKILNSNIIYSKKKIKKNYINIGTFLLFIYIIGYYYFINYLGIGKHGVAPPKDYPPFLLGFLVFLIYFNNGIVFCFYDILIKNSSNLIRLFFYTCFTFYLFFIFFYTLSRSQLIFLTLPFLLLFIYHGNKKEVANYKPILNIQSIILLLCLLAIFLFAIGYITEKRELLYFDNVINSEMLSIIDFLKLLITRIEGARELFLVTDYANKSIEAYIDANLGRFSPIDELYDFSFGGKPFGLTIGFQGLSYLSGSYFLVLIHSLIFFYIIAKFEIFFKLRGMFVFSIYFIIIIVPLVWMNLDLYSILRFGLMTYLIYLTALVMRGLFRQPI